jgi:hypothetical protein
MRPRVPEVSSHVVDQLEAYLLGDLPADMEFELEAHLLHCDACRAECDGLAELGLIVAMLPEETVRAAETAGPGLRLVPGGPDEAATPGSGDTKTRPRTIHWVLTLAAAIILGVVLRGAAWAWWGPSQQSGVPVGNETGNGPPGRMSVTVTDRPDGGIDVQAVVVGVAPGADFTLLAVLSGERNQVVTTGRAGGGPQRLVGTAAVPSRTVLLLVVVQADGTVVAVSMPCREERPSWHSMTDRSAVRSLRRDLARSLAASEGDDTGCLRT